MQQDSFVRVGDRVHDAQGEGWGGEGGRHVYIPLEGASRNEFEERKRKINEDGFEERAYHVLAFKQLR